MKQQVYLVLAIIVLSACDPTDVEEKKGVSVRISSTTGVDVRPQKISKPAPDTSSWVTLLDRTTGITYRFGHLVCARLTNLYRTKGDNNQDVIVINAEKNKYKPMHYRYMVPLKAPNLIKKQLDLFHKAGFLDVDIVTHEGQGQPLPAYRLTKKGWGEASFKSSFSQSLCYETGRWRTSKILDYILLDDQNSGLEAYKIKFETEYKLKGWVNKDLLETFKQKRNIPNQSEVVFVKGPDGYFNPSPRRNGGEFQNTIMPDPEEGLRIANASDDFAARLCKFNNHLEKHLDRKCIGEDILAIRQSLIVHNVSLPGRGNMTVFKFSFSTLDGVERNGRGNFKYNEKEGWSVGGSFGFQ